MINQIRKLLLLTLILSQVCCATTSESQRIVRSKFSSLVDAGQPKEKHFQSILVGIVTPFETTIIPFGTLDVKGSAPSAATIFEIGSLTKGFTGLLLAHESLLGAINLDQSFNSATALRLPSLNGKEITWRNLAQHTSGLPRIPDNLNPKDPFQPYVDYDFQKLESFLRTCKLQVQPGSISDYSNLGAGLVGFGLEQINGKNFEHLLQDKVLNKLEMDDTRVTLNADELLRLAPGVFNGQSVEPWQWKDTSVLQSAGALRSTMHDLSNLMQTMMGLSHPELLPVVELATKSSLDIGPNHGIGLFWNHLKKENIVWHNGATFGSTSFFGYDPDSMVGIIVLSNTTLFDEKGVDPRLDAASIEALQAVATYLDIQKPLRVLKDYDAEVERRILEFSKIPANIEDKHWVKLKIAHMFDIDQYMRNLITTIGAHGFSEREKQFFVAAFSRRSYLLDWHNTQDLKQLIKLYGWFKISKWGEQTDRQAWLLVQHADNDPQFQNEILSVLTTIYKSKETSPSNYAYLYDRVASSSKDPGKRVPQRYGTQGKCIGAGKWEPFPIEDSAQVNMRRAEVGLGTLQDYIDGFRDICN
jgi:D-alanyl-D-alanine-carboxypeptidase/D-alanyl-D-alanine-endopeptidase